jgi:hypothetical protein
VCDSLALGSTIRIPGTKVVAIACEGVDEPAMPLSVPCVRDIPDLMRAVGSEEMLIVDADSSMVIVDPDIYTLIEYQGRDDADTRPRILFETEELPAFTPDGRAVAISALVSSLDDAEMAISQGADTLTVFLQDVIESEDRAGDEYADVETLEMIAAMAVSKPLVFIWSDPSFDMVDLASRLSDNGSITFVSTEMAPQPVRIEAIGDTVRQGADWVVVMPADVSAAKAALRAIVEGGSVED